MIVWARAIITSSQVAIDFGILEHHRCFSLASSVTSRRRSRWFNWLVSSLSMPPTITARSVPLWREPLGYALNGKDCKSERLYSPPSFPDNRLVSLAPSWVCPRTSWVPTTSTCCTPRDSSVLVFWVARMLPVLVMCSHDWRTSPGTCSTPMMTQCSNTWRRTDRASSLRHTCPSSLPYW